MKKKLLLTVLIILLSVLILFLSWFIFINKRIYLELNGNEIETIEVFSTYEEQGVKAYYKNILSNGIELDNVKISGQVDTTTIGEYVINYEVNYNGKKNNVSRIVKVIDNDNPTIETDEKLLVCPNHDLNNIVFEYNAFDNYDGDITDKVIKSFDSNLIYLEVSDSSNNKTIKSINVEYNDLEKPVLNLLGEKNLYLLRNSKYVEPGYSAYDNCDGDITNNVKVDSNLDISKNGTYKIKYTVSDEYGNVTEATRTITVYEKNTNVSIPNGSIIYLTFDDGPGRYTGELLDILKKYDVKATFFVTGQFGYGEYITRAYNEGHAIALHTYSHVYKEVYASVEAYFADLNKMRNKVYDLTGYYSNLVRFPGGGSNTISKFNPGIMSTLAVELENRGYKYFDWNVDSKDTTGISSDKIANNIIKSLGSGKYYVVLQHDIKKNSVGAVEEVIKYGLSHGYTFMPLDETSPIVHHRINN